MKKLKNIISVLLIISMLAAMAVPVYAAVIPGKTGIGMAEWAFRAYNEGWTYKYGGSSAGEVDCSGLIRSYCDGKGGGAKALLDASTVNGSTSDMPRIHGLGLWCEGHAGVYVGKNKDGVDMAIDMRNSKVNVVYSAMSSRYYSPWLKWYKISMISYPTDGWFDFNGEKFYYKNGEFCVGIVKIGNKVYDFGKSGALVGQVDPNQLTTTTTTTTTTKKTTTTTSTTKKTTTTTTTTTTKKTTTTTTTSTTKGTTTTTTASATVDKPTDSTTSSTKKTTSSTTSKTTTSKTTTSKTTTSKSTTKKSTTTTTTSKTTSQNTSTQKTTSTKPSSTVQTSDTPSTTESTTASSTKKSTTTRTYRAFEPGTRDDDVKNLQRRLYELGYYDQDITDYYGPFTRDAVKMFQIAIGASPTGDADIATQKALYANDAPKYSDEYSLMSDESYYIEGDAESGVVSGSDIDKPVIPVIPDSVGIASLSMTADPYGFTKTYGESGALQTMGIFSYRSPCVVYYNNGEKYTISEDMAKSLENCVFL